MSSSELLSTVSADGTGGKSKEAGLGMQRGGAISRDGSSTGGRAGSSGRGKVSSPELGTGGIKLSADSTSGLTSPIPSGLGGTAGEGTAGGG